ncbi:MAG TPA: S24 family peptidase [Isosphaeraceae bacterium]|nr:S24 family peptidase [Isosphaeraceae bacterium]
MARRKNQPEAVRLKYLLAERLRTIRTELYGERGGPDLARRLGVPIRTWYNYESGVTVPSEVVLRFIELTSVEPIWLLHGVGPRFRTMPPQDEGFGSATSVKTLLRTVLARLESRALPVTSPSSFGQESGSEALYQAPGEPGGEAVGETGGGASGAHSSLREPLSHCEWLAAQSEGRYFRMEGNSMAPIVSDGAFVAFADSDEDTGELEGKLVVAWIDGRPMVRWFERSGRYALLRAENPAYEPGMTLLDLTGPPDQRRVRRILWIGTPH